jgi:hypothetical protein
MQPAHRPELTHSVLVHASSQQMFATRALDASLCLYHEAWSVVEPFASVCMYRGVERMDFLR